MLNSPIATTPYRNKNGVDYRDLPTGKARQRKIDHVRRLIKRKEWSKGRVIHYAIHGMRMHGNDLVEALQDTE